MAMRPLEKAARITLGATMVGLALYAADLATRDCTVGPYLYDNCMWMAFRARLGLPASRLLRIATLECAGIALALVLYLAFRYVFPFRRAKASGLRGEGSAFPPSHPAGEG